MTRGPATAASTRVPTRVLAAVALSALGLLFSFASGLGLAPSVAGLVLGALALRDRQARPWPLVAVLAGALGALVSVIALIVLAAVWMPLVPSLLRG